MNLWKAMTSLCHPNFGLTCNQCAWDFDQWLLLNKHNFRLQSLNLLLSTRMALKIIFAKYDHAMGKTTIPHTWSKNQHRTRYAMAKLQSVQKVMWEKHATALFLLAQCQLARSHRTHSLSLFVNYFFPLYGSRKYLYTNCRWLLYIPSGTGMSKANFFIRRKLWTWSFIGEGGGLLKLKNDLCVEYSYFSEQHKLN